MTGEQARITKLGMTGEQARITSKQSWDCHADKSARATNLTGSNRQGGWQFQASVTGISPKADNKWHIRHKNGKNLHDIDLLYQIKNVNFVGYV